MKILSLITHFRHLETWEHNTTCIETIHPNWKSVSLFRKARTIVSFVREWDSIVFFSDLKLPVLVWILALLRGRNVHSRIVYTTFLCDTSRFKSPMHQWRPYELARYLFLWGFVRVCRVIVVHSSAEVREYSSVFHTAPERFSFIHYFVRDDALKPMSYTLDGAAIRPVVAAGRHRDYRTLLAALDGAGIAATVIAGHSDAGELAEACRTGVDVRYEVSFEEYRERIQRASLFVLPLGTNMARSLGQIAVFEAIAGKTPVVAAKVTQLVDYFDDEVLYYQPGDPEKLREGIRAALKDPEAAAARAEKALHRMLRDYTSENYVRSLLHLCGTDVGDAVK
jgi:glycosyltransferase involved in cell wall biosynthesis